MAKKLIILKPMGIYPCKWDNLVDKNKKTYVTMYAQRSARTEDSKQKEAPEITKGEDGIFNIIADASELTYQAVYEALKELSKITGLEYRLQG